MHRWNFPSVFRSLYASLVFVLVLSACGQGGEAPSNSAEDDDREAVLSLIDTLSTDTFVEAFRTFEDYAHSRYVRTEQWSEGPRILRRAVTISRYGPGGEQVEQTVRERLGSFDEDRMPGFLGSGDRSLRNLPSHVLLEDPAFAEPRYAEAFSYTLRPDTTWYGHTLHVAEVRAREGIGDDQALRRVQYYVHAETGELVKLYLERRDDGLLLGEHTTVDVGLRPHADRWLPSVLRAHTDVSTLFRTNQVFRTVVALYNYSDSSSDATDRATS